MLLQNSKIKSKLLTLLFAAAVFILFIISSVSFRQVKSLRETEQLVSHTYRVQALLEQLFSLVKDAETGQRGYVITEDSSFLQPYFNTQVKIDSIFYVLKLLTKDNNIQQKNLAQLRPIINRRYELFENVLVNIENKKYNYYSDSVKVKMLMGKVVMDMLRQKLNEMISIEHYLLADHQQEHKSRLFITPFLYLLLLLFSLIIFVLAYYKINNDVIKLRQLNNELILTQESFKHAEEIAHISHWQWNLKTNVMEFSDNQYLLLGCVPDEFEPTLENFLIYVHPEDRNIVSKGENIALNENQSSDAVFRIIRKDGELRYFSSTGKVLTDDAGESIMIGINYDITEQYLASKNLENRNTELLRSNVELASFNHVASHDLQEPLRKIQLFISRIFDDKDLNLSEKNQDYFKKIQASANRMQLLINDLLAYSRVNGTDKIFENTDLNITVETVLYELEQAQTIEEKNAIINFTSLPEVNGISFQLKQLFTNLIGNSLKYTKSGVHPIINITAEIVNGADVPNENADDFKKYHKISVVDNGMGFEQEYAEKIFTLFQRLHDKQTFSGTGIGLAICKKVVENHHGFIQAISKPNEGSTFIIYLPVSI